MFDTNAIYTRLQNGEDAQAIADEMAKALNDAINKQLKYEEEHKADAVKKQDLKVIMDKINNFIETYYNDIYDEELRKVSVDEVLELVDKSVEDVRKFHKALGSLEKLLAPTKKETYTKTKDIDPIEEFLAKYVDC